MYLEYCGIRELQACRCTTCRVRVGYFFSRWFFEFLEFPESLKHWHIDTLTRWRWTAIDLRLWRQIRPLSLERDWRLGRLGGLGGNMWKLEKSLASRPRMSPEFPDVFRFSGVVFNFSPFSEGASLVLICGSFSDNFHLGDHLGVAFFPFPSPPWSHKLCILSSGAA